jgi:regulator of RNase E activity RraA
MGFPVFHRGIRPVDSLGRARVMAYDVPVKCGEVLVKPGELVFTDFDGIVVVPREVEQEALARAAEKASKESASRAELREGRTLREVYDKHGVL